MRTFPNEEDIVTSCCSALWSLSVCGENLAGEERLEKEGEEVAREEGGSSEGMIGEEGGRRGEEGLRMSIRTNNAKVIIFRERRRRGQAVNCEPSKS